MCLRETRYAWRYGDRAPRTCAWAWRVGVDLGAWRSHTEIVEWCRVNERTNTSTHYGLIDLSIYLSIYLYLPAGTGLLLSTVELRMS